ncbi:MAG: DUF4381 domain-containing protein [Thermodesulfobacteriota bacterium]
MNGTDPLAQLRDIHLPDPVSWWPPAPGWWLLALVVVVIVTATSHFIIRHIRRNRYRKVALRELQLLKENLEQHSTRHTVEQLVMLLRRVAIQTCGRGVVAPLVGQAWLKFLDNKGETDQFTAGPGQVLGEGHYQPTVEADLDQLFQLVEKWIRRSRQC